MGTWSSGGASAPVPNHIPAGSDISAPLRWPSNSSQSERGTPGVHENLSHTDQQGRGAARWRRAPAKLPARSATWSSDGKPNVIASQPLTD